MQITYREQTLPNGGWEVVGRIEAEDGMLEEFSRTDSDLAVARTMVEKKVNEAEPAFAERSSNTAALGASEWSMPS